MPTSSGNRVRDIAYPSVKSCTCVFTDDFPWRSTATVNTGSNGLQNFDQVVSAAKANGIRLIVALTNNWADYGGMDVYVNQILGNGQPHDLFYTNDSVKAAFKNYIKQFVGRYVNEPTILGWELVNEPRCKGTTGATSGSCTTATITSWAKEISAYIKSIDSNHLLFIYLCRGSEGVDFDANLAIDTIDFGTFHSYPENWGQRDNKTAWGVQWIADHAASQKRLGKPVILEEYGINDDLEKVTVYQAWHSSILSSGLAGSLYWQAGSHFASGNTPNDNFAIFPDSPAYSILPAYASALKGRST